MRVGIAGLESVTSAKKQLNRFIRRVGTAQDEELDHLVATVYPEMVAKAPYREGTLESGIYCRRSNSRRNRGVVAGAVAMHKGYNYAPIQHENEDFKHPIKGEAHFISEPLQKGVDTFIQRVQRRLDNEW